MHDVKTPIVLNQYYGIKTSKIKKLPPNYVLIERIKYRNITSYGGGDEQNGRNVVSFACANDLNGKNNCDVTLEDVTFKELGSDGMKTGMQCGGTTGTAAKLSGINNCLKN
jgi:hypothetical protein